MHIEPIEPRTLMANVGQDLTFGNHGVTTLGPHVLTTNVALGTPAGTVLAARDTTTGKRYLYRLQSNGNIDTAFGTGGRVPMPFDAQQLAFDRRTGAVYAARVTHRDYDYAADEYPPDTLRLVRVTERGAIDRTFAGGEFDYVAEGTGPDTSADITLGTLTPLAHGQVLLGFVHGISRGEGDAFYEIRGTADVDLIRLRVGGGYDHAFGGDGHVTVFSGQSLVLEDSTGGRATETSIQSDVPVSVADVELRSDGGYRVISTRDNRVEQSTVASMMQDSSGTLTVREVIDSHVVSAVGAAVARTARTWELSNVTAKFKTDSERPVAFDVIKAGARSDGGVYAIAGTAGAADQLFVLRPGSRPRAFDFPYARNVSGTNVFLNPGRGFYVTRANGLIFKLLSENTPDATFGNNGVGLAERLIAAERNVYVVDSTGGLLVLNGNTVRRFA